MQKVRVFGRPGWGSAIAEAALELAGIPYERDDIRFPTEEVGLERLKAINPLAQVPTLVLPNGQVLTESLAVVAWVDSRAPDAGLIPKDPTLAAKFWRWAVFLVAAIYPTFTYGDLPGRWVEGREAEEQLRRSTDAHRERLWSIMESEASSPYFLGELFSAIDLYVFVMSFWRPRKEWFSSHCPKLASIANRVASRPELASVIAANTGYEE